LSSLVPVAFLCYPVWAVRRHSFDTSQNSFFCCPVFRHRLDYYLIPFQSLYVGRDSSVGIATRYGLDGPGIESLWGARISAPIWGPPSLIYNGYRVFPGGKVAGAWRWLSTFQLSPRLKKEYSYISVLLLGLHSLFWWELYVLSSVTCSPYGPLISVPSSEMKINQFVFPHTWLQLCVRCIHFKNFVWTVHSVHLWRMHT
jgi:hypothetical protein